jgi:hypothetical protein
VRALAAGHVGPLRKRAVGPTMDRSLNRAALTARFGLGRFGVDSTGSAVDVLGRVSLRRVTRQVTLKSTEYARSYRRVPRVFGANRQHALAHYRHPLFVGRMRPVVRYPAGSWAGVVG